MKNLDPRQLRLLSRLGPDRSFAQAVKQLVSDSEKIVVLTADLEAYSGIGEIRRKHPSQFFNVGIAEQNLIGMASGMAREGLVPYVFTYAAFATLRCADQIKMNLAYMHLPVKIVGLSSGFAAGVLGPSHICLEDTALMRSLPGITIMEPADCLEAYACAAAAAEIPGPVYVRLTGTPNLPQVYGSDLDCMPGKIKWLRQGKDVIVFAAGSMVRVAMDCASILEQRGYTARIADVNTIVPLDAETVKTARNSRIVAVAEEHSVHGGLCSAIAETASQTAGFPPLIFFGTQNSYPAAGSYPYHLEVAGLAAGIMADRITAALKE